MSNAKMDENSRNTLTALSSVDGTTIVDLWADPTTHRLLVDLPGGAGTVTSVSVVSANGFAGTVATATTTPAITLTTTITGILQGNGTAISAATTTGSGSVVLGTTPTIATPVINGLATGTGVASAATASTLVTRDANANIYTNNIFTNTTSVVSAGGTTVLTVASSRNQTLTGSSSQTFQLPDATTLTPSHNFTFNNNSSGSLIITDNGTTTQYTAPAGGYVQAILLDNSTANGSWDFHAMPPKTVTWSSGTSGLIFNTALTTTPQINSGASSSTSPSFIPQRGSSTTGYGGDSTSLYGIIGGVAKSTLTATNLTVPAVNKVTITTPATGSTLTIADGKTLTANNSITLAGTDSTTMTFPSTSATIARTDAAQTFTGIQTFSQVINTNNAITASGNAATVPITSKINTVTNNSAATLTITMTTTSAVDGQLSQVRILDASAVAQTITWVNTENSSVSAPTTSNGSTTLPLTVLFQYNANTSKWRCIAYA